jgi:hypothetical protein
MKSIFAATAMLGLATLGLASAAPAEAKGCIKGAIVGGLAGHLAHHGIAGAAAGCVIGHHEAAKAARERREQRLQHAHERQ